MTDRTEQERAAALAWVKPAMEAIEGLERDMGEPLEDEFEIGRIDDSRHSPSFRIRVGHLRKLAALADRPAIPEDVREGVAGALSAVQLPGTFQLPGSYYSAEELRTLASAVLSYLTSIGWGPKEG